MSCVYHLVVPSETQVSYKVSYIGEVAKYTVYELWKSSLIALADEIANFNLQKTVAPINLWLHKDI